MSTREKILAYARKIDEIEADSHSRSFEKRESLEGLCEEILNEAIVGKLVPSVGAASVLKVPGFIDEFASTVVEHNEATLEYRSILADALEKLNSDKGRKAASILRQMNAAASPSFFLDDANLTKEEIDALSNFPLVPGQVFELKSYFGPRKNVFKSEPEDEGFAKSPQPVVVLKTELEVKSYKELFPGARLVSVSGSLCSAFRSWVSDEIYIARHAKTDDVLDYARGRQEVFKNPRLAVLDFETIVGIFSKN